MRDRQDSWQAPLLVMCVVKRSPTPWATSLPAWEFVFHDAPGVPTNLTVKTMYLARCPSDLGQPAGAATYTVVGRTDDFADSGVIGWNRSPVLRTWLGRGHVVLPVSATDAAGSSAFSAPAVTTLTPRLRRWQSLGRLVIWQARLRRSLQHTATMPLVWIWIRL